MFLDQTWQQRVPDMWKPDKTGNNGGTEAALGREWAQQSEERKMKWKSTDEKRFLWENRQNRAEQDERWCSDVFQCVWQVEFARINTEMIDISANAMAEREYEHKKKEWGVEERARNLREA